MGKRSAVSAIDCFSVLIAMLRSNHIYELSDDKMLSLLSQSPSHHTKANCPATSATFVAQ
jgi:hypothetical protein